MFCRILNSVPCSDYRPTINDVNTLRPRQDGRHFPDDILKCIFLNENVWISLTISLKCVGKFRINNIPLLVQIMAWRQPGDKPLSEPMMVSLLTHICVTRPQWVYMLQANIYQIPDIWYSQWICHGPQSYWLLQGYDNLCPILWDMGVLCHILIIGLVRVTAFCKWSFV